MLDVDAIAKSSGGEFDESGGMYFSRKMWGSFVSDLRGTGLPARAAPAIVDKDLPAFPVPCVSQNNGSGETISHQFYGGMTLRQYFAIKALAALINHPNKDGENCGKQAVPKLAKWAYEYADALIEAGSA